MDLDVRVRRMVDQVEMRRVLQTYCRGIDRGDADLISSIYFDDSVDFHGSGAGPGKEFGPRMVAQQRENPSGRSMHFIGGSLFEFDGDDVAHVETYVQASAANEKDGEWLLRIFFGRYLDRFERRDDEWRITRRVTVRDFMGAVPIDPLMADRPFQGVRAMGDVSYEHLRFGELALPAWP